MGISHSQQIPPNVQSLLDQHVCKHCVGRLLSLTAAEVAEFKLSNLYEEDCAACSGLLAAIPKIREAAKRAIGRYKYHDIKVEVPAFISETDHKFIDEYQCQTSCSLKNYLKSRLMLSLPKTNDGPTLEIKIPDANTYFAELVWPTLYITGVYFKRSRRVSHTRFMPGVHPVSSVETELINAFSGIVQCSEIKFQSAGREDMDVRMIGSGRPFCLTLCNPLPDENLPPPKSIVEFSQSFADRIPSEITCNYNVSASDVYITHKAPNMSPKHVKCYKCVVSCSDDITDEMLERLLLVSDLTIYQRTPSRVAHRRELMVREKKIISLKYERICERFFLLDLTTSSGTYIKEFVNSDFGRTQPSLGSLLSPDHPIECQLLQLDVVSVGEVV